MKGKIIRHLEENMEYFHDLMSGKKSHQKAAVRREEKIDK